MKNIKLNKKNAQYKQKKYYLLILYNNKKLSLKAKISLINQFL